MKSKTLAALTVILGIALSTTAFAQGRHDEKPHGVAKPAAEAKDKDRTYSASGRHDEKPHGMKKPAAKKDSAKAAEGADKSAK